MTNKTESLNFKVPLTSKNYETAKGFSYKEKEPSKSRKIYLKILAVVAVYYYCKCMSIDTNLEQSDIWNPLLLRKRDTADLEITGIGKLECRPVLPGEEFCYIPQSVWEDRVGYVVVQIDESSNEATLLGFVKEVTRENLPISELQPLEDLLIHLEGLEKEKTLVAIAMLGQTKIATPSVLEQQIVRLGQWFDNIFEAVWQPPQVVLASAFRGRKSSLRDEESEEGSVNFTEANFSIPKNSIGRAKVIDLGMEIAGQAIALIVHLTPQSDGLVDIRLRVFPAGNSMYLPQGLQLITLDEKGSIMDKVVARSSDNWIQLKLEEGRPGEQFYAQITLGDFRISENFVI